jgi:hypothetical protein
MALKTDKLTASELATAANARRFTPLQSATLDAMLRTGRRYGVSVTKGRYIVSIGSYALNAKGETSGACDIEKLADFATADVDHVIAYLDRMA